MGGNALIREGIHAKYSLGYFAVPLSSLRVGTNTITLLQRRSSTAFDHVMYDYINLELPAVVTLPAGRSLVWRGGNGGNAWDVATTANWRDTNNLSVAFINGDNVTFDNTGATNPTVNFTQPVWPGSVSVISASNYTFSGVGSITGGVQVIKAGAGTLTVNTTNSQLTGLVSLSAGKITLGNAGSSIGTGILELNGCTFTLVNGGTLNNPVSVIAPSSIANSGNSGISGALSGNSTLIVVPPAGNVLTLGGSAANFTGVITLGNGSGNVRFSQSGTWGVPNGTMDAGTNAAFVYTRATGGGTAYLGALSGGPRTTLTSSDQSSNPGSTVTYVIGALNLDSTFAGTNTDVGKAQLLALTKIGTGSLTLSGDSNYRGATRVGAGTLQLTGILTTTNFVVVSNAATLELAGDITADTVQIHPGGTLTGCGMITGSLINDGTVRADCGAPGNLVIAGNVTNNGTMQFINRTGLQCTGTFVNNGLLDLLTGTQGLPANFINNGVVIDSSGTTITSASVAGSTMTMTIQGYASHSYQLQRAATITAPNWLNIGLPQDGLGAPLTFTDAIVPGGQFFYRILVAP